jgi:hypothetical protein
MTAIDASFGEVSFRGDYSPRQSLLWLLPWGAALALGAGLGTWVSHGRAPVVAAPDLVAARPVTAPAPAPAANPYGGLLRFAQEPDTPRPAPREGNEALQARLAAATALSAPRMTVAPAAKSANPYGGLVASGFLPAAKPASQGGAPTVVASLETAPASPAIPVLPEVPLPPKRDFAAIEEEAPRPPARPAAQAQPWRHAPEKAAAPAAPPPADDRNVFEKLFGLGRQPGAVVAYAEPESRAAAPSRGGQLAGTDRSSGFSFFARSGPVAGYDKYTAVYDISARTVYMPDGTRLEAHSGLGNRLDDPRFVNERNRGATPPHLYDLTPREELFHGVQALRLTPVGDGDVFGRAGLLAHSFMLGPNGDSNGCVSFRNYDAFLRAYQQGLVRRLAVVARL